jgi:hypothetical protein
VALFNLVFDVKVELLRGGYDGWRQEPKFARSFPKQYP